MLRDNVLRDLANRATTDPEFLRRARKDLEGTLARYGYRLTGEEMRLVEDLWHRTVRMSDEELARTLANGLAGRTGTPPARPAARRAGAVRAPLDRHNPQADCGEGV
jgi:hypothetical protein